MFTIFIECYTIIIAVVSQSEIKGKWRTSTCFTQKNSTSRNSMRIVNPCCSAVPTIRIVRIARSSNLHGKMREVIRTTLGSPTPLPLLSGILIIRFECDFGHSKLRQVFS